MKELLGGRKLAHNRQPTLTTLISAQTAQPVAIAKTAVSSVKPLTSQSISALNDSSLNLAIDRPATIDCETLLALLTTRELEVVCLIAFGLSNKQIASRLSISAWTVSAHLRRIFAKLHVDTRAAVVYQCATLIKTLAAQSIPAAAQMS